MNFAIITMSKNLFIINAWQGSNQSNFYIWMTMIIAENVK